jgi:hypothetical protein
MRVCQPPVDNIRKVFEVGEKLLDAARDPLLTLLEWRRRLMFGQDGFAVQKAFKELFLGFFAGSRATSDNSAVAAITTRKMRKSSNVTATVTHSSWRTSRKLRLLLQQARAVLRYSRELGEGRAFVHRKICCSPNAKS